MLMDWLTWGLMSLIPAAPPTGLQFVDPAELRGIPLAELPYGGFEMPQRVDLSEHMPRPGFQGKQNSCVAWVSAYAVKTYQEKIEQRYTLTKAGQLDFKKVFSPSFVYNQINQGRDGGATLVDALNVLSGRGAISWAEMPYQTGDFTRQPSLEQLKIAKRYRIAYWRQVNIRDRQEVKAQLMAGYPVMIGAMVDESLYRLKPGTVWRRSAGKSLGGHAMVLVGYDENRQAFKLMNSWGPNWAEHGFGWIDYRQFNQVVREGYVAKDALNEKPIDIALGPLEPDALSRLPESGLASGAGTQNEDAQRQPAASSNQPEPPKPAQIPEKNLSPEPEEFKKLSQIQAESEQNKLDQNNLDAELARDHVFEQHEEILVPDIQRVQLIRQTLKGQQLLLEGDALLPQEGTNAQVLVRFYQDAAGLQPLQIQSAEFSLPNGAAVAVSPEQAAVGERLFWRAQIPLALLPKNLTGLWIKPVLYLDHFGIDSGVLQPLKLN